MHVKSVAIAMASVSWKSLTAAGLRSKISLLIMLLMLMVMNLVPPSQPLYHVHFPPLSPPGQKEGQDKSLLTSLDRHVDNGLGNMVQLWSCSREGSQADGRENEFGAQVRTYLGKCLGRSDIAHTSADVTKRLGNKLFCYLFKLKQH